jgi:hypothetical protein
MKEKCDVCYKLKEIRYRIDLPDGYLEVCSKKCGREELAKWQDEYITKIDS